MGGGGGGGLLNLPYPLVTCLSIYVIDIHHILTFQMSGDTWPGPKILFCFALRRSYGC